MGNVSNMLKDIPIPKMVKVRQSFGTEKLEDVAGEIRKELDREDIIAQITPGMKIAITVGSRGVANIALITKEIVAFLQSHGAEPFVIPAMGSHGGSSAEGQLAIIHGYGVTPEYMGCPVVSTMEVVEVGRLEDDTPVYVNKLAYEADGIVVMNRIKAHTAFRGTYESGVMKMMTIGLGCQKGAESCHRQGMLKLGSYVEKFAFKILETSPIFFGVGLVENSYDETAIIKVMSKEEIPLVEPGLLLKAKALMPSIKFEDTDILLVDYMGKDISGEGMDPNIAGRWVVPTIQGGITSKIVGVLDITEETLGNVVGLGMTDVCSKRVVDKMDIDNTYPNSLTSTVTCLCKIPMYFETQKLTVQAAIKMTYGVNPENVRIVHIKDTLSMDTIEISENMLEVAKAHPEVEIIGEPEEMVFDEMGNLFLSTISIA